MNERLRKIILFIVIITVGSVTILFDIPLIIMIPLILGAGFIIMLLLGTITISEIRSLAKKRKPATEKKSSFFGRLKRTKPEKTSDAQPGSKKVLPPAKKVPEKSVDTKSPDKKTGTGSPKKSFFSSVRSLGAVFKGIGKRKKKEDGTDRSPDKIVTEKVKGAAPASTKKDTGANIPIKGGSPGSAPAIPQDQDSLLSLPDAEFDTDLLDGLEEQDPFSSLSTPQDVSLPASLSAGDLPSGSPDSALPSLDIDSMANDILRQGADAEGLDEFGGLPDLGELGDGNPPDLDFGDLDSLSLDDVELDAGMDEATQNTAKSAKPTGDTSKSPSSASKPSIVKTDWIPSDAPLKMDKEFEQESTHADMLAFAGGATGDEDLLSSLSTDVKRVTKKADISLLRDLKDFQAPATDIDTELLELYNRLNAIKKPEKKSPSVTKGIK